MTAAVSPAPVQEASKAVEKGSSPPAAAELPAKAPHTDSLPNGKHTPAADKAASQMSQQAEPAPPAAQQIEPDAAIAGSSSDSDADAPAQPSSNGNHAAPEAAAEQPAKPSSIEGTRSFSLNASAADFVPTTPTSSRSAQPHANGHAAHGPFSHPGQMSHPAAHEHAEPSTPGGYEGAQLLRRWRLVSWLTSGFESHLSAGPILTVVSQVELVKLQGCV